MRNGNDEHHDCPPYTRLDIQTSSTLQLETWPLETRKLETCPLVAPAGKASNPGQKSRRSYVYLPRKRATDDLTRGRPQRMPLRAAPSYHLCIIPAGKYASIELLVVTVRIWPRIPANTAGGHEHCVLSFQFGNSILHGLLSLVS